MMNLMIIQGHQALVQYDPDIELLRGEFLDLNGSADFYAADVKKLKQEGEKSLEIFFEVCKEKGINPEKNFSGKFNVRIDPTLHKSIAVAAKAGNQSLNQLIADTLTRSLAYGVEGTSH